MTDKKRNEEVFKESLESFINQPSIRKNYYETGLKGIWEEMMGKMVASYTSSIKLSNEKLILEFTSGPLKQEMSYNQDTLIERINERLGKEIVKKIIIK